MTKRIFLFYFILTIACFLGCNESNMRIESRDLIGKWKITNESLNNSGPNCKKYIPSGNENYYIIFSDDGTCDFHSVFWMSEYFFIKTKGDWKLFYNVINSSTGDFCNSLLTIKINHQQQNKFDPHKDGFELSFQVIKRNNIVYLVSHSYEAEYGYNFFYEKETSR